MRRLFVKFLGGCISALGLTSLTDNASGATACEGIKLMDAYGNLTSIPYEQPVIVNETSGYWYVGWRGSGVAGLGTPLADPWWEDVDFYGNLSESTFRGISYEVSAKRFSNSMFNTYCFKETDADTVFRLPSVNGSSDLGFYSIRPGCAMEKNNSYYTLYAVDSSMFSTVHKCCYVQANGTEFASGVIDHSKCHCYYTEATGKVASYKYGGKTYHLRPLKTTWVKYCFSGCGTGGYQDDFGGVDGNGGVYTGTLSTPHITTAQQQTGGTGCIVVPYQPGAWGVHGSIPGPSGGNGDSHDYSDYRCVFPDYMKDDYGSTAYTGWCKQSGCSGSGIVTPYMPRKYLPGNCKSCAVMSMVDGYSDYPAGSSLVVQHGGYDISSCYAKKIVYTGYANGDIEYSCESYY